MQCIFFSLSSLPQRTEDAGIKIKSYKISFHKAFVTEAVALLFRNFALIREKCGVNTSIKSLSGNCSRI